MSSAAAGGAFDPRFNQQVFPFAGLQPQQQPVFAFAPNPQVQPQQQQQAQQPGFFGGLAEGAQNFFFGPQQIDPQTGQPIPQNQFGPAGRDFLSAINALGAGVGAGNPVVASLANFNAQRLQNQAFADAQRQAQIQANAVLQGQAGAPQPPQAAAFAPAAAPRPSPGAQRTPTLAQAAPVAAAAPAGTVPAAQGRQQTPFSNAPAAQPAVFAGAPAGQTAAFPQVAPQAPITLADLQIPVGQPSAFDFNITPQMAALAQQQAQGQLEARQQALQFQQQSFQQAQRFPLIQESLRAQTEATRRAGDIPFQAELAEVRAAPRLNFLREQRTQALLDKSPDFDPIPGAPGFVRQKGTLQVHRLDSPELQTALNEQVSPKFDNAIDRAARRELAQKYTRIIFGRVSKELGFDKEGDLVKKLMIMEPDALEAFVSANLSPDEAIQFERDLFDFYQRIKAQAAPGLAPPSLTPAQTSAFPQGGTNTPDQVLQQLRQEGAQ